MRPDSPQAHLPHSPDQLMKMSDDDLEKIGYARIRTETPDGSPVTRVVRSDELAKREKIAEQKREREPFGVLEVRVPVTRRVFRPLTENDVARLLRKSDFEERLELFEIYEKNDALHVFHDDFLEYCLRSLNIQNERHFLKSVFLDDINIYAFDKIIPELEENLRKIISDRRDEYGCISPENAALAEQDLERIKGKFGERNLWKDALKKEMDMPLRERYDNDYFSKIGGSHNESVTREQFTLSLLKKYVEDTFGQPFFDECTSLDCVRDSLQHQSPHRNLPSVQQEKEVREKMRTADTEEKQLLSGQLKAVAEKRKKEQRIFEGIARWLALDERAAMTIVHRIDEVQNVLAASVGSQDQTEMILYLDGRYNEKLDANPGKVSGDCTEGTPLPFNRPEIPLYNIKCFNEQKRHIGNIYLFETRLMESGENVWHLDAIQIPSRIKWEECIGKVIAVITTEARKKKISAITVNYKDTSISNYSYISDAIMKLHDQSGCGNDYIEMPHWDYLSEEKYSHLQGDGEVRIIARIHQKN